jgi:hypothetical protein
VDLVDHLGAGGVHALDEAAGIPEGERDGGGPRLEGGLECVLIQPGHHVVHHERSVGQLTYAPDLRPQVVRRAEDAGHGADCSGLRDGRHELGRCRGPDGRLEDRYVYSE